MPLSTASQLTVEKTPSYFVTAGVPARIHSMAPSTRLITVVRDPVSRAVSDYTQAMTKRRNLPTFEQLLFGNTTAQRDVSPSWGAVKIGLYARHLRPWLRYFPLHQIHFVNGEGLIANPAAELSRLERFLGIKEVITQERFYFSAAKGFPCLRSVKSGNQTVIRCLGKNKGRLHPKINSNVIEKLRGFFRPHNRLFYQMTGIDFGWL